jgi:hypothetical protein
MFPAPGEVVDARGRITTLDVCFCVVVRQVATLHEF